MIFSKNLAATSRQGDNLLSPPFVTLLGLLNFSPPMSLNPAERLMTFKPNLLALTPTRPSSQRILAALPGAATVSADRQCSPWEYALELSTLLALGGTETALRQLISSGAIEAAIEIARPAAGAPRFRRLRSLILPSDTCFIRAPTTREQVLIAAGSLVDEPVASSPTSVRPCWDHRARILTVSGRIAKQLRRPAASQVTILNVFEESGWPRAIDDPLPPRPDMDAKRRLHDTVTNLNRGLALIRFHGNGDGQSVYWNCISNDTVD